MSNLEALIHREGWKVGRDGEKSYIIAEGQKFPYTHPVIIHLNFYKNDRNPDNARRHMITASHYLWPEDYWTWNSWSERRFGAHCEGWRVMSLSSGSNTGKSYDLAKINALFWWANPTGRNATIASVTAASLKGRVWGYLTNLVSRMAVKMPYKYTISPNPQFLYDSGKTDRFKVKDDTIHGIFAVTAKVGDSDQAISTWIGKHPRDKIMLTLDEGTDMPMSILKSVANLDTHEDKFQMNILGNANKRTDLHGVLSTPIGGWDSIDPFVDTEWETTQRRGICLYFSPYESPAIHEKDPEKRKKLADIFTTRAKLESKKKEYGDKSEQFMRFVMGYWRSDVGDDKIISEAFLKDYKCTERPHWSGMYPFQWVAGLDPSFSSKGDKCILSIGKIGHTINGKVVLDLGGESQLFEILIIPHLREMDGLAFSPERQVADGVIKILDAYKIPLDHLAYDSNGQGRSLGEVIRLRRNVPESPWKIYNTRRGVKKIKSVDVTPISTLQMYERVKSFITHGQLFGMDQISYIQFSNRLVIANADGSEKHLEDKHSFKNRMTAIMPGLAHSPDESDARAYTVQAAVLACGLTEGLEWSIPHGTLHDPKLQALAADQAASQAYKGKQLFRGGYCKALEDSVRVRRSPGRF